MKPSRFTPLQNTLFSPRQILRRMLASLTGLALTSSVATAVLAGEPQSADKLVSKWVFSELKDNEILNKVSAAGPLTVQQSAGAQALVPAEEAGVKGLRFQKGTSLIGKSVDIPDFGGFGEASQPFAIRMVIVPLEKPEGAYGGLFQAIEYGKSGFRLLIDQQMKLHIEFAPGKNEDGIGGFGGQTALESGVAYTVEARFSGSQITLLVNGEEDGQGECGSMAPFPSSAQFSIGQASGENYDFNGIIGEVSVFALKP